MSLEAQTSADVMKIFARGSSHRATASTKMNSESSRSHLICCLVVKLTNRRSNQTSIGKLTLVDLAGSERVEKSGAQGDTMKEAQSINKSLSALGDVISALTSGQQHVPYRNHPLTMLMSDSIGGNAKTLMFVSICFLFSLISTFCFKLFELNFGFISISLICLNSIEFE